ncbi:hypothetical protein [Deinococcus arenicola]|uniref:Uncharacterized protein n=1 Tax=Deinococcus arenicola TaxID=2994950 RepID=A0ABU4DUK6_9DEIO|nr:hypothetical protein [Deinococcus sp. ZS9-10]MDV6376095.1 hypothetical protein [Deinococcus sp. ZS9-10]
MKVRRPAQVEAFIWERLPRGARLALASHYARTPQRAAALRAAAVQHTEAQLQRAVSMLEGVKHER